MNELVKVFENSSFGSVRVVMRDGDPWFVAKDVCDCLQYSDASNACRILEDDEKQVITRSSEVSSLFEATSSTPSMTLISESGLYTLIMRSNKPEAKVFRKWVTNEVLPSIRRTGRYEVKHAIPDFSNPAEAARAWADAYEAKQKALEEQQKALAALGEKELELSDERQKHKHDRCHDNGKCGGITKNRNHYKNKSERLQTENTELQTENNELQDAVGRGKNWMTISVMKSEWISKYDHKPDWKKLKEFSKEVGIAPIKDVDETVKHDNGVLMPVKVFRYHKDAWERYRKYEELLK